MAISDELMLAILAMDSYNQGYGAGIEGVGTKIGTASQTQQSDINPQSNAVKAGFYAVAYNLDGQTIISYRGTDGDAGDPSSYKADIVNGYGVGLGLPGGPQAAMATDFYRAVAGVANNPNADPFAANVLITGHSLGGGLVRANDDWSANQRIAA